MIRKTRLLHLSKHSRESQTQKQLRQNRARALCVITPGVLGAGYFRDVAAVFAESAGGPADLQKIGEVMRRHGLTPAPPA